MQARAIVPGAPATEAAKMAGQSLTSPRLLVVEPLWLHHGPSPQDPTEALARWSQFALGSSVVDSPHYVPDVALAPRRDRDRPLIYVRWGQERPEIDAMAILDGDRRRICVLPGLSIRLRRRRVCESQLVGNNQPAAISAFVSTLCDLLENGECDCVSFDDLEAHSPMRLALKVAAARRGLGFHAAQLSPHRWIRFPKPPEQYWSRFSKKTRYNFRYRAKHLQHTVRCLRRPDEVPEFLRKTIDLAGRTWQHRRLGMSFDPQQSLDIWTRIARAGGFRSYLLERGDRPLAYALGFCWKNRYVYAETGYDPEFAANSPGQVLLYRVIEDLIARETPDVFDFGFGDSEYKRIYANDEKLCGSVVLVRRAAGPVAAMMLEQMRADARRAVRRIVTRIGLASVLRHLHRGHSSKPAEKVLD